jgi:hypothetical protein
VHLQQQILDAFQAVIAGGDTDAEDRVYLDRLDPVPSGKLPACVIEEAEQGEVAEPATIKGHDERTLFVQVTTVLKDHAPAETAAAARAFGLQVEKLIAPSTALRALCKLGVRLISSRLARSGEGNEAVAARVQVWACKYIVHRTTPDVVA